MSSIELIRAAAADLEHARIEVQMHKQRNIYGLSTDERLKAAEDCAEAEARAMRAHSALRKAQSDYAKS